MIGIVGHPDLTAVTLKRLERELRARLEGIVPPGTAALARVGAGLPVAFARAVRKAGLALVAVLPAQGALPAPLAEPDAVAAGEMLVLAEHVRLVDFDPRNRDACVTADETLIQSCRRILAVWDGSWSTGRDATAHLVAYARSLGVPVDVVWPTGASREGGYGVLGPAS
jgi:hypothetical protein